MGVCVCVRAIVLEKETGIMEETEADIEIETELKTEADR